MMLCFLPFLLRRKFQLTGNEDTAIGHATSTQGGATSLRWNWSSTTLIFAAALLIRLVASTVLYGLQMDPRRDYWEFGWETGRIAHSISAGKGFSAPVYGYEGPTAWMAPVYPYLLAGVFRVFGDFSKRSALAILGLNSFFSALTCFPVFHIARRVLGPRSAIWAGWAWAVYPFAIYFASVRVWETCLTTLLLSLALWLTLVLADGARPTLWAIYGGLWAVAALTSPVTLSVLPALAAWIFFRTRRNGAAVYLTRAMVSGMVFLILVTPWFVRNFRTFHQFVPFRDNFGLELRMGNNGDTSDVYVDWAHPAHNPAELHELVTLGEIAYFQEKKAQALDFIRKKPGFFLWITARRFVFLWTGFWSLRHDFLANEPFEIPDVLFTTPMAIVMLIGMKQAWHAVGNATLPLLFCIALLPGIYYLTHVDLHYRHPVDPVVVIFVAYAIRNAWVRRKGASFAVQA